MRYSLAAGAILAASVSSVVGQDCAGSQLLGGNWYCDLIESIIYGGFPTSGTYNGVKSFSQDGQCEFGAVNFDGPLGVFGEELSVHLRGPAHLKKLAVYSTGGSSNSKRSESHAHAHAHGHAHAHAHARARRNPEPEPLMVTATINNEVVSWEQSALPTVPPAGPKGKAAVNGDDGVEVTATIFGQVVSWLQGGPAASPTPAVAAAAAAAPGGASSGGDDNSNHESSNPTTPHEKQVSPTSSPKSSPKSAPGEVAAGTWARQAYYDASSGTADGLVFLNHMGGSGSGVFDNVNGNSLSYASKDGKSGSSSPQVLDDTLIEDDNEIVIMSDKKCNNDCGVIRPGTVAYHGWSGNNKVFVAEVDMPLTGKTGFNADMPSLWLLNAAIPRTNQYGSCSCWKGGCGEFDILEVLDSGNKRCKSTIHAVSSGGDSNYFDRPTDKTVHVAVVFDGDGKKAHIKILQNFDYSGSLSAQQVQSLTEQAPKAASFMLGSS